MRDFLLLTDTAKTCVVALTISALEMKETMYKLLPGVLLNLSKISATVSIAPNILEFLSTLNRLPEVYSSFVEEQYLSIFAITLPFINPFKVSIFNLSLKLRAHPIVTNFFFTVQSLRSFLGTSCRLSVVPVLQIPFKEELCPLHCSRVQKQCAYSMRRRHESNCSAPVKRSAKFERRSNWKNTKRQLFQP